LKRSIFLLLLTLCLAAFTAAQEHQQPAMPEHSGPAAEHGAQGEGEGGGHGEKNLDTWKWINFAILAGIVGYAIYKKGGVFFAGRTAEIRRDLEASARMKADAEARYADVERRLAKLGDDIAELKKQAQVESAAEGERIRHETERNIAKIRAQAEQDIASAATAAQQELRAHAAALAVALAQRKIGERLTPEADAALVQGMAAEIERRGAPQEARIS
jgi:F-type H+-transporting ATPase subunit b